MDKRLQDLRKERGLLQRKEYYIVSHSDSLLKNYSLLFFAHMYVACCVRNSDFVTKNELEILYLFSLDFKESGRVV